MDTVAITTTSSYNTTDHEEDICLPLKKPFLNAMMALPALVALENLFILLAMLSYKEKLKKRNLNMYVASTIAANFIIGTVTFYHFLNYYYGFESYQPNLWWAFRKGLTLSMSLVMLGNIGLLIYGIDNNTYIVARVSKISAKSSNLNPVYRRRKAIILIIVVWLLPIVYGAVSMISWNCTQGQCTCTLRYKSNKPICPEDSCSHLYTPMSKSYLLSITIIFILECLGLVLFIIKSIIELKGKEGSDRTKPARWSRVIRKYARIHRLVIYLLVLFFLSTTPSMILITLDYFFTDMVISHEAVNFILPLPLISCLISPILIYRHVSDIPRAVSNLLTLFWSNKKKNRPSKRNKSQNELMSLSEKQTIP